MRVIFMGTPDFAVNTLEEIVKAGNEVVGVFTQPDKPKGRGKELSMSAVKVKALELNLPVFQPERVRNPEVIEEIRSLNADIIVVVAFGQLLPKSILEMTRFGCVNVHASLLPAYRGASPIQSAVIDGCKTTGITTMMMDEGLDTGDILMQEEVQLDKKETGGSLFNKLCDVGANLLVKTLFAIEDGTVIRKKQNDELSSYAHKFEKSSGEIHFNEDATKIECLIRGLNPWPSAYTYLNNKTLKIWDADVIEGEFDGEPGRIIEVNKNDFVIKCGVNALKIKELQLEGKKRMTTDVFLRGYHLEKDILLGR